MSPSVQEKPTKTLKRKKSAAAQPSAPIAEPVAVVKPEEEQKKTRKRHRKSHTVEQDVSTAATTEDTLTEGPSTKPKRKAAKTDDDGAAQTGQEEVSAKRNSDEQPNESTEGKRKRKRKHKSMDAGDAGDAGVVAAKVAVEEQPKLRDPKPAAAPEEQETAEGQASSEGRKRKRKRKSKVDENAAQEVVEGAGEVKEIAPAAVEGTSGASDRKKKRKKAKTDETDAANPQTQVTENKPADEPLVVEGRKEAQDSKTVEKNEPQAVEKKLKRRKLKASVPVDQETTAKNSASGAHEDAEVQPTVFSSPSPSTQKTQKSSMRETESSGQKTRTKKAVKPKSPLGAAPSEADKEDEVAEAAGEANSDADEDVHLYGFSTDDEDSSDDEMAEDWAGLDVTKLPTVAKDDAVVKKKLEKAKRQPTEDRGVIYLGRIPHGFYEDQMRSYFSQFGDVTRLRLSRNKKTGQSKHYAFIEFDSSSVAQIVAETMDNYLLMGHILTCKVIPKDEVHPELWIGANRKWRAIPRDRIARVQHNKPRTEEEQARAEKRLLKRQAQKKRKLEESGIKYDFDSVAYKKKAKPTEV